MREEIDITCRYCGKHLIAGRFQDQELVDSKTGRPTGEILIGKWLVQHPKVECLVQRCYTMGTTLDEALQPWVTNPEQ